MTKKSFIDNPALRFISTPASEEKEKNHDRQVEIIEKEPETRTQAVKVKKNPIYIETKSKRVQLLMQPTLHTQLGRLAKRKKVSFNELVHKALEKYAEEE